MFFIVKIVVIGTRRRRQFSFVLALMAGLLVSLLFIDYLHEKALHELPYGVKKFSLYDPLRSLRTLDSTA